MSPSAERPGAERHVVVTGAGSGIGRAIALRLARDGARLALLGRGRAALEETLALAVPGATGGVFPVDVREPAQVERVFAELCERQGPIHALVANAGIGGPDRGPDGRDRFTDLVTTNLLGTHHCIQAARERLAPGPAPRHLVLMASILARIGVPGYGGYCASKAALLGLTRALAAELAGENVQVNALCPGWVDTRMARAGLEDLARQGGIPLEQARADALSQVPLGRMSTPDEIAGVVSWLLSPDARGVTGQGLDVNNGAYMI